MNHQTEPPSGPVGRPLRSRVLVLAVVGLALVALVYAFAGSLRPTLSLGDEVPAFRLTTYAGLQVDSDQLRGSVLLINFFASWCKPCQEEAADLEGMWQEYRERGVLFVGIAYQDMEKDVAAFVAEHGLSFQISDDQDNIARKFGVTGVPETYVVDRQGRLAYKRLGAVEPALAAAALESALAR